MEEKLFEAGMELSSGLKDVGLQDCAMWQGISGLWTKQQSPHFALFPEKRGSTRLESTSFLHLPLTAAACSNCHIFLVTSWPCIRIHHKLQVENVDAPSLKLGKDPGL